MMGDGSDPTGMGQPGADLGGHSFIVTPNDFHSEFIQNAAAQAFLNVSGQNLTSQFNKFQNRLSETDSMIRPYFAVNGKSVLDRLGKLLFPFTVKNWSRMVPDGHLALPVTNPNLPELYTPLVCSFAFILLTSVILGVHGLFTFEKISMLFLKYFTFLALEIFLAKLLFVAVGAPGTIPVLTLAADLGTSSFYLVFVTFFCWHSLLKTIALVYCGAAAVFWSLRSLNPRSGIQTTHSTQETYSIFAIAVLQALLPCFLVVRLPK
jgi:hypothetical protein